MTTSTDTPTPTAIDTSAANQGSLIGWDAARAQLHATPKEEWAEQPAAASTTVTYYGYDLINTNIGVSNGKTIEQESSAVQPANTFNYPPPAFDASTQDVYFDMHCWIIGKKQSLITPQAIKDATKSRANSDFACALSALQAGYLGAEIDSWQRQETDAVNYESSGKASVFLTTLAATRNQTVDMLVASITEKADIYNAAYAKALGTYQSQVSTIDADPSPKLTQDLLMYTHLVA